MTEESLRGAKLTKFHRYLEKRGAEILESHNPYELVRFKIYGELCIIYKKSSGWLTFAGDQAETAFKSWQEGKNWQPVNRKRQRLSARKLTIAKRDGLMCFFCLTPFRNINEATIEHILAFRFGGTDNINNLALACDSLYNNCNLKLGHLPITKKMLFRDERLREKQLADTIQQINNA